MALLALLAACALCLTGRKRAVASKLRGGVERELTSPQAAAARFHVPAPALAAVMHNPLAVGSGAAGVTAGAAVWAPVTDADGDTYFVNSVTGESAWVVPEGGVVVGTTSTSAGTAV